MTNTARCPTCGRGDLKRLLDTQLIALELRSRGKTTRAIAKTLGIHISAVEGRYSRARASTGARDIPHTIRICTDAGWLPMALADASPDGGVGADAAGYAGIGKVSPDEFESAP